MQTTPSLINHSPADATAAGNATFHTDSNSEPTGMPTLLTRVTNFATQVMGAFRFEASNTTRAGLAALTYAGFFAAYQLGRDVGRQESHAQGVDDMTQHLVEAIFRSGCNSVCNALMGAGNTPQLAMEGVTALAPIRTYPWDVLLSYPSDQPEEECGMERAIVPAGTSYAWHRPF